MRPHSILLLIMACAACAAPAQTVSLDSCRSMALHNNKLLRMADEGVRGAGLQRKAAFSAYLPGIDFNGGYMYNQHQIELLGADGHLPVMSFDPKTMSYQYDVLKGPDGVPVTDPATGQPIPTQTALLPKEAMEFDTHNVFAGAFTLTQPIYMGGMIRAMNDITKYAEQAAVAMRNNAAQDIVYAVDEAYWQVVSLKSKRSLAESYAALCDSLRHDVQAMLDEGVATRSDLLTVEVKCNEAQIMLTKVDNGLALSRMALAQICGLPVDTQMSLSDEGLANEPRRAPAYSVDMQQVYAARQDLEVLRQGISMMRGQEKLALGAMLPKVALVGGWAFSNPNVIHGFEKRFGGGWNVGATVSIPLWHWGGNYNRYKAAQAATNAQRLLLEDMEEKVDLQVQQARFRFQEAFKTYDMTLTNMSKADENLRQAQLAYQEGVLTTDDVTAAQTAWLQASSERIDAEIGIRLCEVYLSKVTGSLGY